MFYICCLKEFYSSYSVFGHRMDILTTKVYPSCILHQALGAHT